jgi:steroid delta-isomerase-like uncharacterized protein
MSVENIDTVQRLFDEVWNQGKFELIDELLAENYVDHDPLLGESDREGAKAAISGYRAAFPDLKFTVEEIFAAGDRVVVRWIGTGTFENELMGLAPTGDKGNPVEGLAISHLADGKIVETHTQWDTLRFLKDIGAIPEDAAAPAAN